MWKSDNEYRRMPTDKLRKEYALAARMYQLANTSTAKAHGSNAMFSIAEILAERGVVL